MSAERIQLGLLRAFAELGAAPWIMGGYAEDALLAGTVTRPHADVDLLFPRPVLAAAPSCARSGSRSSRHGARAAPGEPFYLSSRRRLDRPLASATCHGFARTRSPSRSAGASGAGRAIASLSPRTRSRPPPPRSTASRCESSPLALVQMRAEVRRAGLVRASIGTPYLRRPSRLRERFFPGLAESELTPRIEPL